MQIITHNHFDAAHLAKVQAEMEGLGQNMSLKPL
jgi:hypothetical protein